MKQERELRIEGGARKRQRVAASSGHRWEEFKVGSILRIRLVNFMTYNSVKVEPGARMNLIIGPNGTGKSSIVCAIAVGLAYKPSKLLERGDNLGDFIQRGKNEAMTEITLKADERGEEVVIQRRIRQNGSQFFVNGKAAKVEDVETIRNRLGIQLDNLCQFLPQEKVAHFAKQKAPEKLLLTEKAVNPALFEYHQQLIDMKQGIASMEVSVKNRKSLLQAEVDKNAELEKEVELLRQRDELLDKVRIMELKRPWAIFESQKAKYTASKENLKKADANLKEKKKMHEELSEPLQEARRVHAEREQRHKDLAAAHRANQASLERLLAKLDANDSQRDAWDNQEKELRRAAEAREREVADLTSKIARLEAELAEIEAATPAAPKEELRELRAAMQDKFNARQRVEGEIDEIRAGVTAPNSELRTVERKLQEFDDQRQQRLNNLRGLKDGDKLMHCLTQLERMRGHLKGRVYGPLLMEVNVPDADARKYLEQHVSLRDWSAFIVDDADDFQVVFDEFRKKIDWRGIIINGANIDVNCPIEYPDGRASEYAQYGITATLDQVFQAPEIVRRHLIGHFQVNRSFIGTAKTSALMQQLLAETPVRDVYTPELHVRKSESRYSSVTSSVTAEVRPSRLFTAVDLGAKAELVERQRALRERVAEIERQVDAKRSELRAAEKEEATLRKEIEGKENAYRQALAEHRKRKSRLTQELTVARTHVASDGSNLEAQLRKIEKARKANLGETYAASLDLCKAMLECWRLEKETTAVQLERVETDAVVRACEAEVMDAGTAVRDAERLAEQSKAIFTADGAALKQALQAARAVCALTEDMNAAFAELPSTVEELDDMIMQKRAEADRLFCPDPTILQQYKDRVEAIKRMGAELAEDQRKLDESNARIDAVKAKWLPPMRTLVAALHATFSASFQEISPDCGGAVELVEDESGDYAKYSILIKVKFREGSELCELDDMKQSGGERSVSTMLYLIAMQAHTRCPFRVVDEINQGMDDHNERKVFRQMVRTASIPETPQSFVLTPKLLPDLDYSDAVTVLCIFNGPYVPRELVQSDDYQLDQFFKRVSDCQNLRLTGGGAMAIGPAVAHANEIEAA